MRRDARRGRGGAAVAAWALAWTLAACFAGEAWGQSNCTTQVVDARSFDLGYGRRFDLTSKGGNVKYFIGFEELVEYTSTFWQTVLVNRECPAPPPPNPPPPNPPPPAQASGVESSVERYDCRGFRRGGAGQFQGWRRVVPQRIESSHHDQLLHGCYGASGTSSTTAAKYTTERSVHCQCSRFRRCAERGASAHAAAVVGIWRVGLIRDEHIFRGCAREQSVHDGYANGADC